MLLERDWQARDAGPVLRVVPSNDRRARINRETWLAVR